jgi:hypothetical protein
MNTLDGTMSCLTGFDPKVSGDAQTLPPRQPDGLESPVAAVMVILKSCQEHCQR